VFVGLRSLTPPAATAWGAHLGWLRLPRTLSWIGAPPAVAVLTLLALAELVADKLPRTPSRTAPAGLSARIVMGALTGACLAAAGAQGVVVGAIIGAVGGIAGCFGGHTVRIRLVQALGAPDFVVAVLEDLVAVGGALWVVSRV
jgi:uncharacterized membrane protein